jgi:hypothetical protein
METLLTESMVCGFSSFQASNWASTYSASFSGLLRGSLFRKLYPGLRGISAENGTQLVVNRISRALLATPVAVLRNLGGAALSALRSSPTFPFVIPSRADSPARKLLFACSATGVIQPKK